MLALSHGVIDGVRSDFAWGIDNSLGVLGAQYIPLTMTLAYGAILCEKVDMYLSWCSSNSVASKPPPFFRSNWSCLLTCIMVMEVLSGRTFEILKTVNPKLSFMFYNNLTKTYRHNESVLIMWYKFTYMFLLLFLLYFW